MKIALFKSTKFGFDMAGSEILEDAEEYVRLSEYVDINFVMRTDDAVVTEQVDALKEEKKKIQAATEMKLNRIDQQISELLALSNPLDEDPEIASARSAPLTALNAGSRPAKTPKNRSRN